MILESTLQVTVIVCAYTEKRWSDLKECLKSLQSQTWKPKQIILVVDHNPALFELAKHEFIQIQIVENVNEQGLSGARNTALPLVQNDILSFIDEDAIASPTWLETLVKIYQDSSVMGVGGLIRPNWVEPKPGWFPEEFNWVVGCSYLGLPEKTETIRNMIGCNMSFRRENFEVAKGFREDMGRIGTIPLGCEETEFCIRLKNHWPELKFVYEPMASVDHRVPPSRSRFAYFRARCYAEGLSKALVSKFVGAGDGLSSERQYTFKTLPKGMLRGLVDFFHGDITGFGRTIAIVTGLFITTIGYVVGLISMPRLKLNES